MNPNRNEHIDDDLLKKLISLPKEEKLPDDFTQKVMSALPKPEVKAEISNAKFPFKMIAIAGFAALAFIFLIFNFDLSVLRNLSSDLSANHQINYLNIITSALNIFKEGFSGFKITNISITAIVSLATLYFADKFLKRYFEGRVGTI